MDGITTNVSLVDLFTLGIIYRTNAGGAKQMPETNNNRVENPNWPEANLLNICKRGRGFVLRTSSKW